MIRAFSSYDLHPGANVRSLDAQFPTDLEFIGNERYHAEPNDTGYGYLHAGHAYLVSGGTALPLRAGMYFSSPGPFSVVGTSEDCFGILIIRRGYHGVLHLGGPVEAKGRLRYIDGCTDSLLVPPQRRGEPCLNLLQFPPGIDQTSHTHPSARIGMVISGHGRCVHTEGETVDLVPGMVFCIHTDGVHKFQTPYGDEMRVVAYHPDSDFGPTDDDHPMLNRTIVEGASARDNLAIRTRADVAVEYE
jgi:quercetin dioxygenase-like cupin family protein